MEQKMPIEKKNLEKLSFGEIVLELIEVRDLEKLNDDIYGDEETLQYLIDYKKNICDYLETNYLKKR